MKILAIDTATEACSVALSLDGQIYSTFEICPQQHSQRILPMIDDVLTQAQLRLSELDFLAFGQGPGSFTGVRIATGILQGLALGSNLQVIGVSTLAAMAQQVIEQQKHQNVAVAIDARMSEVYWGCFRNQNNLATLVQTENVLPPQDAVEQLPFAPESFTAAGTGWNAYQTLELVLPEPVSVQVLYPDAKYMLALAIEYAKQGLAVDVEHITPVYLRDKVSWKKLPGK